MNHTTRTLCIIVLLLAIFAIDEVPAQVLPVPLIAYEVTEQPAALCGVGRPDNKGRDVCVVYEPRRCVIVQHPFAAPSDVELARLRCLAVHRGVTL